MSRFSRAVAILTLIPASPSILAAQATPTERAAAGSVLNSIDSLQKALGPEKTADRLIKAKNPDRDRIMTRAAELWDRQFQGLSDWIGHHPEIGFEEVQAVDTILAVLRKNGFKVDSGVAGLATAFVATWVSPAGADGPVLGLIGEYDALRGTAGPFHGDQHNAQSPVALSAGLALKEFMTDKKIPGTIKLFGTPAEEMGPPSKSIMRDAGIFKGTSILVRSHSSSGTGRARPGFGNCCLNINNVRYIFTGQPSHQMSSWNGRNALEAAVHFYMAVDGLRSTFRPEASIQGIIPEGGTAPNVVPDRAVVDYYVRYPDGVYLEHIQEMMDNAARGAALATGTEVKIDRYGELRDGITTSTLEELKFGYAKSLGAPRINEELNRPAGYEETGGVAQDLPGVGVSVASSTFPNHTMGMLEDAFTDVGHRGFRMDAQIMAMTLYHFLTDAQFRQSVQTEHTALQGLYQAYQQNLRKAYATEMAKPVP